MAIVNDVTGVVPHVHRDTCRCCRSKDMVKVLDFGDMPLAGGFLSREQIDGEQFFPLRIYFCRKCFLVQNLDVINHDILFKNYFYLSSSSRTGVAHFQKYADTLCQRFASSGARDIFVVEIGSNDGVLLAPLKARGCRVLGIDPASNVVEIARKKGLDVVNDFFTEALAENVLATHGKADVITANNVFAHIDDLDTVMRGINLLLKDEGIFVFEVHYLYDLLEKLQYDTIYHEHFCYDSLLALKNLFDRFKMEIFDVQQLPMHEGTIRVYVKNKSNTAQATEPTVQYLMAMESKKKLDSEKTYLDFAKKVEAHKEKLVNILSKIRSQNKRIVGYGAAGRGNTLLNYAKIGTDIIEYIVDESPLRQNKFTPGTHIPIYPVQRLREDNPDYIFLIAWSYKDEILEKEMDYLAHGGRFIVPFPKISVI